MKKMFYQFFRIAFSFYIKYPSSGNFNNPKIHNYIIFLFFVDLIKNKIHMFTI